MKNIRKFKATMICAWLILIGSFVLLYLHFHPKVQPSVAPAKEEVKADPEPETKIVEIAPANFQRIKTVTPEAKVDVDPAKAARDAILLQEGYGTKGGGYKVKIVPKDRQTTVSQTNVGQQ